MVSIYFSITRFYDTKRGREEMKDCIICKAEADIVPIQRPDRAEPTLAPICDECIAGIKGWSNKKEIANKLGVMLDTMRTLEGGKR